MLKRVDKTIRIKTKMLCGAEFDCCVCV